jgi:hypothetical protein
MQPLVMASAPRATAKAVHRIAKVFFIEISILVFPGLYS